MTDATGGETTIRRLDEATVQRIAAGEVVERPASVVKELVENSIDADASRVDVAVEAGGTERVAVRDDGVGMTETDVRAAVKEHTTSKIGDIDDLESGVATLGFRGEALYTIGAVARLDVTTKPRGADGAGTTLRVKGGSVESVEPAGCPEGTTVEVTDLFYNTPARKKYLKTEATEFSHVNTVVTQYALANPDVAFSLSHDGRETFATTGQGDLRSTVLSVYGRDVATSMIELDRDGDDPLSVSGLISDPETTRSTREYMATYVNGRYVSSATVREAVLSAYGDQLSSDRYPFAVVFLDVPGESVDVNVHPRKMEIRFDDEEGVRERVREGVEDALLDHGLVRTSAPRGRSAPDETDVRPANEQAELTSPTERPEGDDEEDDSSAPDGRGGADLTPSTRDDRRPERGGQPTDADASTPTGTASGSAESGTTESAETATAESEADRILEDDRSRSGGGGPGGRPPERKFDAPTEATALGDERDDSEFDRLPRMRLLGQLRDTYLVAETPDGMVLVDQHAADERINYERLRERFADDSSSQVLASPVELELTAREAALFDEYQDALAQLGFHAGRETPEVPRDDERGAPEAGRGSDPREGDGRTVEVKTVPAVLAETLDPELLRDALGAFVSTDPGERGRDTVEAMADALLSDLACYPSITGNTSLREGDAVELLTALDDCENPYACPHGRPVLIELSEGEIEDRFERDYPGHAERR